MSKTSELLPLHEYVWVFGDDFDTKTCCSGTVPLAKSGISTKSYGFPGGRSPAAGMAVCQPYSLLALAKLEIGSKIHRRIQSELEWIEIDWYSGHTGISGMHFVTILPFILNSG